MMLRMTTNAKPYVASPSTTRCLLIFPRRALGCSGRGHRGDDKFNAGKCVAMWLLRGTVSFPLRCTGWPTELIASPAIVPGSWLVWNMACEGVWGVGRAPCTLSCGSVFWTLGSILGVRVSERVGKACIGTGSCSYRNAVSMSAACRSTCSNSSSRKRGVGVPPTCP
ncbi:hypothetical protein IE81DRAFT_128529 [Ceraceosorus guamensis]|uniref:Uncharacterized protein n=1 Tax=Ceraceosorus guamensis TaxID=1522189 RepID=A0A316W7H1_9BASI|nr:hypothetical protein IE81DRAFT_128529 [Ceraceosorus guamensis]PWN45866.1 hypothetical protein IE81DRAFT_128529 [Ceraceosorus guamensis]